MVGREGDILGKVCLLRMRPKNWPLKASGTPRNTGRRRYDLANVELMRRGCHECQYFHYFAGQRQERVSRLGKSFRKKLVLISFFLPFFLFSFCFFFSAEPFLLPAEKNMGCFLSRLIFRGCFPFAEAEEDCQ